MYSTCLFCHARLGRNAAVERFPVGRRIAFDPERGRLWAVCGRCRRWNLSPLATRWEAVEECERIFRDTRTRVSTENIGLARTREGTELVRVGAAPRGELAAWRYGDRIVRRGRRAVAFGGLAVGTAGGLAGAIALGVVAGWAVPLLFAGGWAASWVPWERLPGRSLRSVRFARALRTLHWVDGGLVLSPGEIVLGAHLVPGAGRGGWSLEVTRGVYEERTVSWVRAGSVRLGGPTAEAAVRLLMARANAAGARSAVVRDAVGRLEAAGAARAYFARANVEAWSHSQRSGDLWRLPLPIRLALEMAANEEQERRALDSELTALEAEWREAEAVAAIADRFAVPTTVERALRRLHRSLATSDVTRRS